jgi:hypothetical protein
MRYSLTRLAVLPALAALFALSLVAATHAQQKPASEHDAEILGVRVGMTVPEALQAVYEHTATTPPPQKPDALREEGKDKKDVRVVYKSLKEGELQIVFAGGRNGFVREVSLNYSKQLSMSDLYLPSTTSIENSGDVLNSQLNSGVKIDDRYAVGFTDDRKTARFWWRDERTPAGYEVRVGFISGKISASGALADRMIVRKDVMVKPGDDEKFWKAVSSK